MNSLSKLRRTDGASAIRSLARDESGATALEYGLIASILGLAVISAMTMFGGTLTKTYDSMSDLTAYITLDR